jgi:hypothetical protein
VRLEELSQLLRTRLSMVMSYAVPALDYVSVSFVQNVLWQKTNPQVWSNCVIQVEKQRQLCVLLSGAETLELRQVIADGD